MSSTEHAPTIYQHPLAYLLGLHGVALMRAYAGDFDEAFTRARLAEVRDLLARADEFGDGWEVGPANVEVGYDAWAPTYDGDNPFFAMDEGVLLPMLDELPVGRAVDAACGTGRYAAHLAARGHTVHGVDASPGMLEVARAKVPSATFSLGGVDDLPVADDGADLVVNTLALCHVEALGPFFAETARVLSPGGHLLVSDTRGYFTGSDRSPFHTHDDTHGWGYVPTWSHPTAAYLRAALDHGFTVRDCQELVAPAVDRPEDEEPAPLTPGEPASIWALHPYAAAAAHAAKDDRASLIVWHFQLP